MEDGKCICVYIYLRPVKSIHWYHKQQNSGCKEPFLETFTQLQCTLNLISCFSMTEWQNSFLIQDDSGLPVPTSCANTASWGEREKSPKVSQLRLSAWPFGGRIVSIFKSFDNSSIKQIKFQDVNTVLGRASKLSKYTFKWGINKFSDWIQNNG